MGSNQSVEQWVDQIPVPASKPTYPSPEPPSFLLPDLLKSYKIRDNPDNIEGTIDWNKVKQIATTPIDEQAAIETGRESKAQIYDAEKTRSSKDEENVVEDQQNRGTKLSQSIRKKSTGDFEIQDETRKSVGIKAKTVDRISFDEIDMHARKATPQQSESFNNLFDYLKEKVPPNTRYPGVYLVRGITAWFCNQDIDRLKPVTATLGSPAGLVQHIKNRSLTLTSSYALLIRAANIPCVIIQGFEKGGHYSPGDPIDNITEGSWVAVYVDRSWQIIHPLWACRGTYSVAWEKENRVLIEDDSQKESDFSELLSSLQKPKEPPIKYVILDYFMPKPDVFKYKCIAFDQKWNLLSKLSSINPHEEFKTLESTLSAKEHFRMQPCLSPAFFKCSLQLVSLPLCTLLSDNGAVRIQFEIIKELTRKMLFRHKLSVKDIEDPMDEKLKPENISRLVLYHRCNDMAIFDISLPKKGTYIFEIIGGVKGKFYNIAAFLLMSPEDHDVSMLPLEAGIDGWGPGPKAQQAGLLVPSKPKGIILYQSIGAANTNTNQQRSINVQFDVSNEVIENNEFTAEVIKTVVSRNDRQTLNLTKTIKQPPKQTLNYQPTAQNENVRNNMKKWVSCTKDRLTKKLDIDIILPTDGIYALIIRSTELEDKPLNMKAFKQGTTTDVCYYLLKPFHQTKQGPKLKFAKAELLKAMNGDSHGEMKTAIERCLTLGLEVTDEDIATCIVKMEHLKHKTEINECIRRRNLSVLNDTLLRVIKYRYRAALVDDVIALLEFRKRILAIDGYQMYLPTIREAIDELYKMPHIPPEVHNTMAAVLVVLKHPVDNMDWAYIKNQLRTTGNYSGHLARQIEKYETTGVPPDITDIRVAEQILYRCTFPQVLRVNHSAASFYKWVEALTIRLKEYDRKQREYAEQMASRQAEIDRRTAERRKVKQAKKEKYKHRAF